MPDNTIQIGAIGVGENPYTADMFKAQLAQCDPSEPLILNIHSEGGSVLEGFEIFNALQDWEGRKIARIRVAAFSIASYIAMACDEIEIANNGFFMIHNPYTIVEGDDKALQKNAQLLTDMKASMVSAYVSKTGLAADQVESMMADESYIGASQAIEIGMADRVIETTLPTRELPRNQMPALVAVAMFGKGDASKDQAKTPESESEMSNTTTVAAASVKTIKQRFPKASDAFIVRCMDDEMSMDDVGEEYAKAMEEENESLKEELASLKAELEQMKAEAEEDMPVPAAVASGADPVRNTAAEAGISANARADWDALVAKHKATGKSAAQAVIAANRENPALRQALMVK